MFGSLSPVEFAITMVICVSILLVLPAAATVSALKRTKEQWASVGRSRLPWLIAFPLLPLLIGPIAALIYFGFIRSNLPAVVPSASFSVGDRVTIAVGPLAGTTAVVASRPWVLRPMGLLGLQTEGQPVRYLAATSLVPPSDL